MCNNWCYFYFDSFRYQELIVRMDTKGEKPRWGGDGGVLNWAIGIDMYTLMCIKLVTD